MSLLDDDIKTLAQNRIADAAKSAASGNTNPSYYELVPKHFYANCIFRKHILRLGMEDEQVAKGLIEMCRLDVLFYVNVFCWLFTPSTPWLKSNPTPRMPWVTWEFQDRAFRAVKAAIGHHDLVIDKSRDMGASWILVTACEHSWHFEELRRIGFSSRNESLVDDRDNPKSLFWKVDFLHEHQPHWLLPRGRQLGDRDPNRTVMHLLNADNSSTIDGEATTSDQFRGDRLDVIVWDEAAAAPKHIAWPAWRSMGQATPCRLVNSTYQGSGNAFHSIATDSIIKKLSMFVADHPIKRRGLYHRDKTGKLFLDDVGYWEKQLREKNIPFSPDNIAQVCDERLEYEFREHDPDVPVRSPWIDAEEDRSAGDRAGFLQEVMMRPDAASKPFFDEAELREHRQAYCCQPLHQGELSFERGSGIPEEFKELKNGSLSLWFRMPANGKPPDDDDYVAAADIATGSRDSKGRGKSNSVLTIGSKKLREMVAQFVVAGMPAETFAEHCIAICYWFAGRSGGAQLIWEVNGPGGAFGVQVSEMGYGNLWYRDAVENFDNRITNKLGWHTGPKTKGPLLVEFRRAIAKGEFVVRSEETIDECKAYEYTTGQRIEHSGAFFEEDPSQARENHGDRVMSAAMCWWAMRGPVAEQTESAEAPVGSFGWRQEMRKRTSRQKVEWRKHRLR